MIENKIWSWAQCILRFFEEEVFFVVFFTGWTKRPTELPGGRWRLVVFGDDDNAVVVLGLAAAQFCLAEKALLPVVFK